MSNRFDAMSAHNLCRGDLEAVLLRSRMFTDRRCFNLQISPLPCRRTASVVSEFVPLTPFRSRSARPPSTPSGYSVMQRGSHGNSHVSVARFFDWSEQDKEERVSVSRLYREIAGGAGAPVGRSMSEKVRPRGAGPGAGGGAAWGGAGGGATSRLNPGRMFLRDKGMLTKGEREIIEGIYKNRGDLRKDPAQGTKSDFFVRSHHDAWLVGKPGLASNKPSTEIPRDPPRGCLMEVMAPANPTSNTPRGPGSDGSGGRSEGHQARTSCIVCAKEQQLLQQLQQQKPSQSQRRTPPPPALSPGSVLHPVNVSVNDAFKSRGGGEAPVAPPTSPDLSAAGSGADRKSQSYHRNGSPPANSNSSRLLSRKQGASPRTEPAVGAETGAERVEPGGRGWGERGEACSDSEGSSQDSGGSRRKLRVRVFLPKVGPEPAEEDVRTCLLQGRPALARERPLSHRDLKGERRDKGASQGEDFGKTVTRRGENQDADVKNETGKDEQEVGGVFGNEQEKYCGNQSGNGQVESQRKVVEDQQNHRQHQYHHRKNSKVKEEVGELSGEDSDGDNKSRDSWRRASLHTHPVTILRAQAEDCRLQDE